MNWSISGRTQDIVGEDPSEGGRCDHLVDDQQAYGYTGEADSFGEERHYLCKECYEQFLLNRQEGLTECGYCKEELPLKFMHRYVPYMVDGSYADRENSKMWICTTCRDSSRHQARLEQDREERERDADLYHDD